MKLLVLDRDGVINHDSPDYIKTPREWIPIPGSLESIARLNQAGYRVAVATNQAGIARGLFNYDDLFAIHDRMTGMLAEVGGRIDGIFYCPHGPDDGCDCRKPAPGLLLQISSRYKLKPENFAFVGDSMRDLEAAQAAGATPVLVRTGNGASTEEKFRSDLENVAKYDDLAAYVDEILDK